MADSKYAKPELVAEANGQSSDETNDDGWEVVHRRFETLAQRSACAERFRALNHSSTSLARLLMKVSKAFELEAEDVVRAVYLVATFSRCQKIVPLTPSTANAVLLLAYPHTHTHTRTTGHLAG